MSSGTLGTSEPRVLTRGFLQTAKPGGRPNRGETYAEDYALRHEAQIWERYQEAFGAF